MRYCRFTALDYWGAIPYYFFFDSDTVDAHGDQVDESWMRGFRKRFWGLKKPGS